MHQEARWKSFTIDTGPRPPEFPESMDIGEGYGRCIRFHSRGLSRVEEFRNAWGKKKKERKKDFMTRVTSNLWGVFTCPRFRGDIGSGR